MLGKRKKLIIDIVLSLFLEHGNSFKMDDVAKAMKISKKTIYKEYGNKEELIILVVNSIFESISNQLDDTIKNNSYTTLDKLLHATCDFPDTKDIDYHKALLLKDDFPKAYNMFIQHIEDNWQINKQLFEQAVREGLIKNISHDTYRIITLGITKQVLNTKDVDQEALLEKCIRQVFEGITIK